MPLTLIHLALGLLLTGTTPISSLPTSSDTTNVVKDFVGQGRILVLNSSSLMTASPQDSIGCLNSHGVLTQDDCAVFTRQDEYPHTLVTPSGSCTWANTKMPTNVDSVYGKKSHAWSCTAENDPSKTSERYYTVKGFRYPFLCNGNIDCYYDIKTAPSPDDGTPEVPVWQYFWGSQQMGITPGHLQTIWLWQPVNSNNGLVSE